MTPFRPGSPPMVTRPINRSAQRSPPDAQPSPAAQPGPDLSPSTAQDRIRPPRAAPDSPHRAPPPLLQQTRGGKPRHPVLVRRLLPQLPPLPPHPPHPPPPPTPS